MTNTIPVSDDLTLALSLASTADTITMNRFEAADLKVETKPDLSPVSDADTATERELRRLLEAHRPDDAILGEEFGGDVEKVGRQWVIDPIDGTKNFVRGVPVWATLIGLLVDGVATVGVVSAPALGRRWWAAAGMGAWRDTSVGSLDSGPSRLEVSGVKDVADASLSISSLLGWEKIGRREQLVALGDRTPGIMGSPAFRDAVAGISREVGENAWPMPLPPELNEALTSDVADIRNISGSRSGGMLVAGHYLGRFVTEGVEWVHIDVAGPAYNTGSAYGYTPKRGTGVPVRTIIATLEWLAAGGTTADDGEEPAGE